MTVNLTVSTTINGAAVSDTLAGGGSGVDMGQVANNTYAPLTSKAANTGAKSLFLRHDAVTDPITSLKAYIQEFGVGTGFAYGGDDTAPNDFTTLSALGLASGISKNNADGFSAGFWMDMEADVNTLNQFDINPRPTFVKTFGKASLGIDLASSFTIVKEAMVYNLPPETNAITPIDGYIGKAGDTILGDNAHLRFRIYIPNSFLQAGIMQWETVFTYAFTG